MKQVKYSSTSVTLFKLVISSYFLPLLISGTSGFFLNKPELLRASYSTIALPSLIATIICLVLLFQLQKNQLLLLNRRAIASLLGLIISVLTFLVILLFQLQHYLLDILPSAVIGAIVVGFNHPFQSSKKLQS